MHERERERCVGVLHVVWDHEGDRRRDSEVSQEDEEQRRVDRDRDRELRVLGFFTAGKRNN